MATFHLRFKTRNHDQAGISASVTRYEYIEQIFSKAKQAATADEPSVVKGQLYAFDMKRIKRDFGLEPTKYFSTKAPGYFYVRYIVPNPDAVDEEHDN